MRFVCLDLLVRISSYLIARPPAEYFLDPIFLAASLRLYTALNLSTSPQKPHCSYRVSTQADPRPPPAAVP